MHLPAEQKPTIGYVVSTWPRLSQTFVLNEILALERRGLPVRIFSIKDPRGEPVHAKLAKVRAPVAYLSFRRHGRPILLANLRIARDLRPDRKSTRLNSSHGYISYAVFCLKKKKNRISHTCLT